MTVAKVPRWAPGEPLAAARLNQTVDGLNEIVHQVQAPQQLDEPPLEDEAADETWAFVSNVTTELSIPIYDADDPTTQIGTATAERITEITLRTPAGVLITLELS